jgi:hypothetical protein
MILIEFKHATEIADDHNAPNTAGRVSLGVKDLEPIADRILVIADHLSTLRAVHGPDPEKKTEGARREGGTDALQEGKRAAQMGLAAVIRGSPYTLE